MVGNTSFARVAIPAFALAVASLAPVSVAQVKRVEPYFVVTTERGNLRCGDGELFYKIGDVAPGLTLMVDGESSTHLQVAYPPTLSVGVRAEDTELQNGVLKLVKASKLKALNLASGWSGSWKSASPTEVPAGTTLRLLESIKDADGGPIVGYRVAPPDQARAFIETRLARRATEAEVAAWKAKSAALPTVAVTAPVQPAQPAATPDATPDATGTTPSGSGPVVVAAPASQGDKPTPSVPAEQPAAATATTPPAPTPSDTAPATTTASSAAATTPTPSDAKTETPPATSDEAKAQTATTTQPVVDLTQPVAVPPAPPAPTAPVTQPQPAPTEIKPVETVPTSPSAGTSPQGTAATPAPVTEVTQVTPPEAAPVAAAEEPAKVEQPVAPTPRLSPYDLEETFNRVWREPIMNSEMDELVGQYTSVMENLDPQESDRLLKQLKGRRDALQLRIELREKMRQQAEARAAIEAGRGRVAEQLRLAEDGRVYTIIGQLQPSTVYDGQKLPLMYRIVSVGGVSPRTLGYLKDDADMNLLGKIGAVVGVIGEAQVDRSLMLNVITPVRVDVLKPKGESESAAAVNPGS